MTLSQGTSCDISRAQVAFASTGWTWLSGGGETSEEPDGDQPHVSDPTYAQSLHSNPTCSLKGHSPWPRPFLIVSLSGLLQMASVLGQLPQTQSLTPALLQICCQEDRCGRGGAGRTERKARCDFMRTGGRLGPDPWGTVEGKLPQEACLGWAGLHSVPAPPLHLA